MYYSPSNERHVLQGIHDGTVGRNILSKNGKNGWCLVLAAPLPFIRDGQLITFNCKYPSSPWTSNQNAVSKCLGMISNIYIQLSWTSRINKIPQKSN